MNTTEPLTDAMLRDLQRLAEWKDPAAFECATKALQGRPDMRERCVELINHLRAVAGNPVRVVLGEG